MEWRICRRGEVDIEYRSEFVCGLQIRLSRPGTDGGRAAKRRRCSSPQRLAPTYPLLQHSTVRLRRLRLLFDFGSVECNAILGSRDAKLRQTIAQAIGLAVAFIQ